MTSPLFIIFLLLVLNLLVPAKPFLHGYADEDEYGLPSPLLTPHRFDFTITLPSPRPTTLGMFLTNQLVVERFEHGSWLSLEGGVKEGDRLVGADGIEFEVVNILRPRDAVKALKRAMTLTFRPRDGDHLRSLSIQSSKKPSKQGQPPQLNGRDDFHGDTASSAFVPHFDVLENHLFKFSVDVLVADFSATSTGGTSSPQCGDKASFSVVVAVDTDGCHIGEIHDRAKRKSKVDYANKHVIVNRGGCSFMVKALWAQQVGAIGLIIINTNDSLQSSMPYDPAYEHETITIGVIMVGKAHGNKIMLESKQASEQLSAIKGRMTLNAINDCHAEHKQASKVIDKLAKVDAHQKASNHYRTSNAQRDSLSEAKKVDNNKVTQEEREERQAADESTMKDFEAFIEEERAATAGIDNDHQDHQSTIAWQHIRQLASSSEEWPHDTKQRKRMMSQLKKNNAQYPVRLRVLKASYEAAEREWEEWGRWHSLNAEPDIEGEGGGQMMRGEL
jgi:hypothetical protein